MNALWWWIDRWRKSTAFTDMTLAEQGAYRNLLDEATLRGGALPDDDRILAKASGDAKAWPRLRARIMRRFELKADGWHNETLDSVLYQSERRKKKQARWRHGGGNEPGNEPGNASGNGAGNAAGNAGGNAPGNGGGNAPGLQPGNGGVTTPVTNPVLRSPISRSLKEPDPTPTYPSDGTSSSAPLVVSPLQFEKAKKSFAFYGSRLKVPHVLHAELRDKLGGDNPEAALQAWYLALNTDAEETRAPIVDVFKFVRPKFEEWAAEAVASAELARFRPKGA